MRASWPLLRVGVPPPGPGPRHAASVAARTRPGMPGGAFELPYGERCCALGSRGAGPAPVRTTEPTKDRAHAGGAPIRAGDLRVRLRDLRQHLADRLPGH